MILIVYAIALAVLSIVTFILYGVDKKKAKSGSPSRIPEFTLLTMTALGGGVGALAGRYLFRHKVDPKRKFHFTGVTYISLIVQIGVLVLLILPL